MGGAAGPLMGDPCAGIWVALSPVFSAAALCCAVLCWDVSCRASPGPHPFPHTELFFWGESLLVWWELLALGESDLGGGRGDVTPYPCSHELRMSDVWEPFSALTSPALSSCPLL